ncbi:hypothetical protein K2173_008820 [Erythroxylum novogranatense]|uniref:Transmembrane protein n=1 Tax=Erythroxylum novogranatense TaxID=1862640 RepID=A0AAV8UCD7_9ROSI|nr:hypothetical protein K2173_008820 [Erythroxylum novogranatense]
MIGLIYWYDFICFSIVVGAYIGSLWVLWRKELVTECDDSTFYDSLLAARPDNGCFVETFPSNHVSSSQLWTTCWKGVSPIWLLLTRFMSFLIMAALLTWDIVDSGPTFYVDDTGWTFTLVTYLMIYFGLAAVISTYGCFLSASQPSFGNGVTKTDVEEVGILSSITYREKEARATIKLQSRSADEVARQRAGFWGYLMQILYQTSAGAVVLTEVGFWCIIVPFGSNAHLQLDLLMGCMHILSAVFLLIDTALNNLAFPWFRMAYLVQWSCFYVVFQWVIHACAFTWLPEPFLALDLPWAPLWYFVLAIVHIPCYGLCVMIVNAKNSIFPRLFPLAYVRSY